VFISGGRYAGRLLCSCPCVSHMTSAGPLLPRCRIRLLTLKLTWTHRLFKMTRNDISYLTYLRLLLITKITRAIISLLRSIPHSLGGRLYTPPTRTFTIPSSKDPSYQRKIMINVYEPPQMWEGMTDGLKPRPVHINFHGRSPSPFVAKDRVCS
jgi:hypothetical protein